ncbi:MAG: alpha/beta fold hydrolase [Jatrophihabitans sp.]|nr:MAG: alpha/beta fold hydrolase [Jatrophihabitans sp.]
MPDPVRTARRIAATARNTAEVVRFGGLRMADDSSGYAVEAEGRNYRLRRYFPQDLPPAGSRRAAPAALLIPPLMMSTEVWDVSPDTSAVAALHRNGVDAWVIDFGDPGSEPGGLARTLTDHVLACSDAVDHIAAATGRDVVVIGYSQGGMFAYQTAAYRRCKGIDSLVTFGSPVDTTAPLPIPVSPEVARRLARTLLDSGVLHRLSLPRWAVNTGFKLLSPARTVQDRARFLLALHDRDALLPRERQRRFLASEGWTAYSGPAIAELLEQFVTHNRMLEGGFVIDDRLVTLADIDVPILIGVGLSDTIGHPDAVRAIRRAAPRADVYELTLRGGHFGLVVGSNASRVTWPAVAAWIDWREGSAQLPASIVPAELVDALPSVNAGAAAAALAQATDLGVGVGKLVADLARGAVAAARGLVTEAPTQLTRLARLEQLQPTTRISLGLLLDEQARRSPEDVLYLFGDRAYRQEQVKHRIDSVVKGLVSVGVHHGDRVGVLMRTRPSAFSVVAALSRLGATAVLLRPDGDVAREAGLGRVVRIVSDPDNVGHAAAVADIDWCVLGAANDERALPDGVVDMERIDIEQVELPGWYRANPQRAADVAFVLFNGEGRDTRAMQITNRRWALSALGTATAASLRPGDTVYSVTPIHHSSALLMSVGGAVAGGARFAMAETDDPQTFWEEVRRYGASHVSYTWTSLRGITNAAPSPAERHHPIRMFMGSGMPRNLWRRVSERFPTARVLEFYASAEGEVILANLTGSKPGSMGRPVPGTAEVRVARYDLQDRRLRLGEDGLAAEAEPDEVGLLLARVDPADPTAVLPLRGVFEPGDAWRSTGDLFLRDEQGDLWLAGAVTEAVPTARGIALPSGTRYCLGSIPAVDLVIAYGVPDPAAEGSELLVGAVTLRPESALSTVELDRAFERMPSSQLPDYVQVVTSIPVTTWHRPLWRTLQAKGIPHPGRGRTVFRLGTDRARYEELA